MTEDISVITILLGQNKMQNEKQCFSRDSAYGIKVYQLASPHIKNTVDTSIKMQLGLNYINAFQAPSTVKGTSTNIFYSIPCFLLP